MGLFALFGGYQEFDELSFLHETLLREGKGDGSVRIVPLAMTDEGLAADDLRFYNGANVRTVVPPIRSRSDAEVSSNAESMQGSSLIFIHGGMPSWVAETLRDSAVWHAIASAVNEGASLAATSGGIMALGGTVPVFDENRTLNGWVPGLGLFPSIAIGSHWNAERLEFMRRPYETIEGRAVLAVDEATAVMGDGETWSVHGAGAAHLREGSEWRRWEAGETFTLRLR